MTQHNPAEIAFFGVLIKAIPYLFLSGETNFKKELTPALRAAYFEMILHGEIDPDKTIRTIKAIDVSIKKHPEKDWGSLQRVELAEFKKRYGRALKNGLKEPSGAG